VTFQSSELQSRQAPVRLHSRPAEIAIFALGTPSELTKNENRRWIVRLDATQSDSLSARTKFAAGRWTKAQLTGGLGAMIHHLSLGTNDLKRAKTFYDPVITVLGLRLLSRDNKSLDYGVGMVQFSLETLVDGQPASPGNGVHVAFLAEDPDMIDEFYRAAWEHRGTDDGRPGLRPEYNAHYYGAFVRDPDGNKIEAVTHSARQEEMS
jgi:catechol 2,3-dioxygenase-like lactoylglutathione lyase family enzyme